MVRTLAATRPSPYGKIFLFWGPLEGLLGLIWIERARLETPIVEIGYVDIYSELWPKKEYLHFFEMRWFTTLSRNIKILKSYLQNLNKVGSSSHHHPPEKDHTNLPKRTEAQTVAKNEIPRGQRAFRNDFDYKCKNQFLQTLHSTNQSPNSEKENLHRTVFLKWLEHIEFHFILFIFFLISLYLFFFVWKVWRPDFYPPQKPFVVLMQFNATEDWSQKNGYCFPATLCN